MIPLMLDMRKRRVVIFGGGEVGLRKARYFADSAVVDVVSRSFDPGFDRIPVRRKVELDIDPTDPDRIRRLLEGSFLAVAATSNPALNNSIGDICREMGILFNNAGGSGGDVIIPSIIRGERYCLAISTGGESPAVPRFVREFLEEHLPDLDGMIRLQHELRMKLQERGMPADLRRRALNAVIRDPEIWVCLSSDPEKALRVAEERYVHEYQ
ncbi:MAG: precorrin-2 dehydrogenase/sirohydrochlorin ferrochelatase family protein [Methanoculleaceae archaeon]